MLLMSWLTSLQNGLVRGYRKGRRRTGRKPLRRGEFTPVAVRTESLEDRALLSAFSEAAATLNIDINGVNEALTITTDGVTYTISTTGTFSGTDSANVTGNGGNTLTVTPAGLAAFNLINVTDSASGASVAFGNSSGAYSDDFTVNLLNPGSGQITFSGASTFAGAASLYAVTNGSVSGSGTLSVGGALTLAGTGVSHTGAVTVTGTTFVNAAVGQIAFVNSANDFVGAVTVMNAGANSVQLVDTNDLAFGGASLVGGTLSTQSATINISGTVTAGDNIVLQPKNLSDTIGVGDGAVGTFNLDTTELTNLSSSATVTIGLNVGTGDVDINDINLSSEAYSLQVRGGSMTLDSITLANNKTLTLNSKDGSISDTNGGTANITIGGGSGTAILTSATGIGSGDSLETSIDRLSATATASGNVQITDSNSLTIDNPVSATGGSVVVQATGTLTTTASGTVTAGSGTVFLIANDMVLGAAINGSNGVELRTATGGTQITLGTGATGLALSNTELNLITVGGSAFLTVGDSAAGAATIDSAISLTATAPRLRVLTNAGISFTSTGAITTTSGVELDGSTITTTSSASPVITAPSSVNLLARVGGIGSSTNPITLAGTGSLSILTTGNADAVLTTGTASGVASFNAGSGFVEFQGGTFNLSGSNVINDSTKILLNNNSATLGVGAFSDTIGGLTMKSGSVTGTGTLTSASTFLVEGGTISAILAGTTGAVGLTKSTGGIVSLSGNNTFSGPVSITDGNLTLNRSGGALADGVAVTLTNAANAVLTLNFAETIGSLAGGGGTGGNVNLNGQTLTTGDGTDTVLSGAITGSGTSNLVKQGSGKFTLDGANTYNGTTTISAGTLAVGNGGTTGALGGGAVSNSGTLQFNRSDAITVGNGVTGTGAIQQIGSGTTNLTGTNSASAGTSVSNGRLNVNGTLTSNVSTSGTGILGGSGTITGNVSGNGTVSPGNSPGVLTITGNFTPTGTVAFEVNPPAATAGTDYDQILVSGTVDLSGATLTFSGNPGAVAAQQLATLISKTSGGAVTPSTNPAEGAVVPINGNSYRIFYNGGDGNDVVLVENSAPTTVYVDDSFVFNNGQVIADADLGTTGAQPAIFGVNAFTTINAAVAAATASGTIIVNSGTYTTGTLSGTQTLRVTGSNVAGAVSIGALTTVAGQVVDVVGSSVLTVGDATDTTVAGVIQGTGSLIKTGAGTVTLSGNNTYSGATTVSQGVLSVTVDNALGTTGGGTSVASGATLDFNGVNYTATEALTVNGGALANNSSTIHSTFAGAITLGASGSTVSVPTSDRRLKLSGNVGDGGSAFGLTKSGSGTLFLSGTNTYTGQTSISSGAIHLEGGAAIADTGSVALTATGTVLTLDVSEAIGALSGVSGTVIFIGSHTLTTSSGLDTSFAGSIQGTGGGLTKDGAGTLTLSGANFHTGTTTVNGGNLTLSGGSAIDNTGAVVLANTAGVVLTLSNSERIGSLSGGGTTGGNVSLGASTLTTGDATDTTFAGVLSGVGGGLTKAGTGKFTLTGTNTYSGTTTISAGTLEIGNGGTTGSLGTGGVVDNATLVINRSNAYALNNTISGTGAVQQIGGGTTTISGNNSYAGLTTVSNGTLAVTANNALGTTAGATTVAGGATIDFLGVTYTTTETVNLSGTISNSSATTNSSFAGNIALGADVTATVPTAARSLTLSGGISGGQSVTKTGAGTLVLSGTNTFSGALNVNVGGVTVVNGNAIDNGSTVTLANVAGVVLTLQSSETIGALEGGGATGGNVDLGANTLTTGSLPTSTFGGVISGTGGLTLNASNSGYSFILTGSNTYTGQTTITNGFLELNAGGTALSDSTPVVINGTGGKLFLNQSETVGSLAGTGGEAGGVGGVALTAGGLNTDTTFSGMFYRQIIKVGSGKLTFDSALNAGASAIVNAGTLALTGGDAMGDAEQVVINGSGNLQLLANETIGWVSSGSASATVDLGANTLTTGGGTLLPFTFAGVMSGTGGGLTKTGGSSTMTLTGANTYTGATTISAGILELNNAGGNALSNVTAVNLSGANTTLVLTTGETIGSLAGVATSNVTLNANTLTTGGNNGTTSFGGVIAGTGGLTKAGSGTMTLTGSNTYGGTTQISDGSLVLNHAGGAAINDASNVNLSASTANLTLSSATETVGSLTATLGSTISLGANTLTTTTSANTAVDGVISGVGGSLVKNGSGQLTLSATNTYSGTTTIGTGSAIRLFGTNGTFGGGAVSNSGTVRFERSAALTVSNNITGSGAIEQNGSGRITLTGTDTAGAGTSVLFGRLDVNGTLGSNVTVTNPGVLGGTGTITGNVGGTGVVAPGTSPGILNVVGTFGPVGSLSVEINGVTPGTQHDQVNVTGGVNLGGTTVLDIDPLSSITTNPGQQIVLINNDDTDAITGTFLGRAEGSTVIVNGLPFVISYIGGLNGNDVTLTQQGVITITGTAAGDQILLQEETISGLDYVSYYLGGVLQTRWLSSIVASITVNAGDGNDTLTVNYGASGGFFAKNITYNGGNQTGVPGDSLVLDDTGTPPSFTTITHSFTDNNTGSVLIDGTTISYGGLEPITDNLNAANRVFTFNGGDETIALTASGAQSMLDSTQGESVVFTHPTASLTINSMFGNDTLNLSSIGAGFNANFSLYTGSFPFGTGTVNFDSALLNFGAGNIILQAANSVNFSGGSLQTSGTVALNQLGAGGVTADAAGVDIIATSVTSSGASGAIGSLANQLRTSVGLLNISVTAPGAGVFVVETDAISLSNVTTNSGSIQVTANGTITATGVGTLTDNDANDVVLLATSGNIIVGSISTGGAAGDVTLTATTGSIVDDANDGISDITADVVTLTAGAGVGESGGNGSLDTTANSLDVSVTAAGLINLNEANAVTLTAIDTANGAITISAAGTITATNVTSTTDDNANDIAITATTGNIEVGTISAGATDGDVTLLATTGAILDDVLDTTTDVTGDVVTLTAATGIGESGGNGSLDTAANSLDVSATGVGLINLNELNAVTLTAVDTANGAITVLAAGTITITNVTSTTDNNNNDIVITASTGDVVVGVVNAGLNNGDVTITATLGAITDNTTDSSTDVTGDVVTLTAATGVGESAGNGTLDTQARSLDVSVTSAGLINLAEFDLVTLTAVDTADGPITITANGTITATSVVSTTDAEANDISLTATSGDVALGVVRVGPVNTDATAGDVTIQATNGAISDIGSDTTTDVQGDVVSLTASGDIGQTGNAHVDTRANSLVLSSNSSSVNGTHGTWINEFNAVTVTSASTTDGVIVITSAGTMTVTSVTAGNTVNGARDVNLVTSTGNVLLDSVSTSGANASIVRISAAGGIVDNNGGLPNIASNGALLRAVSGIGSADALETTVSNLSASNTTSGNILITNTGGLTITSLSTFSDTLAGVTEAAAGNIVIRALSPLTVNSTVLNSGGGNITLASEGNLTTDDLTLAANVTATGGTGSINLYAGGDILQTSGTVSAASTGPVNLSAGENFSGGANAAGFVNGNVTQSDGAVISSVSGVVTIEASGSVNLATVNTSGDVTVSADDDDFGLADNSGAITDSRTSGEGAGFTNIVGATVNLFAASGIGNGTGVLGETADIDINATNLNATNLTSGAIQVFEVDSVALGLVDNGVRNVVIEAGAAITDLDAGVANDITAGTIHLRAVTGIGGTGVNAAVETTAPTVNATNTTSGGIFLNSLSVVNFNNIQAQTAGNIELTSSLAATLTTVNAASGNVNATVTSGDLTVASSVTAGGAGDIDFVTLLGNIVLSGTTTAIGDDVTMVSSGNITGNGLVTGNTFSALAVTGIGVGTGNRVQTAVNLIRLGVTSGAIYLNNVSPSLTTFSLASPAGVGISASGLVDLVTSNNLTIANGARVQASGTVSLQGGAGNTGATITLDDTVDGSGTPLVLGGGGNDDVIVNDMSGATPIDLNAQAGDDSYTINYYSGFMPGSTANINVVDSSSSGSDDDTVNIYGTDSVDNLNVKEDAWLAGSFRTLITGGRTGRVNYVAPTPSNARLTTLNVFGRDGQDNFFVSPSRYFTINVFGGNPFFGPTAGDVPTVGLGDTLDFDPNGQNFTIEGRTILTSSYSVPAPTFRNVNFSAIENLPLTPIADGMLYFDFDALPSTTNPLPVPPNWTPTQAGYQRVLRSDLYVAGNPNYTYVSSPYNTTYATRKFGWEAQRDGSNNLVIDQNGFYVSPVLDFDSPTIAASSSAYANLVRDGHWSGSDNTQKSIFRFEVPNGVANAGKWYVASVKVVNPTGYIDNMRVRNADDPDTSFFLVNNITTTSGQVGEFKFPVKANANGEIRLEFSDNGGSEGHWYLNSLEVRPGQLLSFGGPSPTLTADGQTIDTQTIYGAVPGSVVTITTTMGTLLTTGALPDIDPIMEGLQRPVDGAGQAQFNLRRANASGLALLLFKAIANGTEGTFENTGMQEITFVAPPVRRFDFGTPTSPVMSPAWSLANPGGYLPITSASLYSASVAGAGWVTAAPGGGDNNLSSTSPYLNLIRDGVGDTTARQFSFDLPAGTYQLTAIVGSVAVDGQNISVVSGGTGLDMTQVTNFETTNGQFRSLNFTVNKTGTGPLVLQFNNVSHGKQWSINGLEARSTGDVTGITVTPPGGSQPADGTTVDTFNVSGSGIGAGTRLFTIATTLGTLTQINNAAIVDADPSIAGVQFDPAADSFTIQVTRPAGPGTATVTVDEVTGAARGSGNQTYVAPAGPRRFDFGTATSPVQAGYTQISPATTYSATGGWGWLNTTLAADQGAPAGAVTPNLIRDVAYAWGAGQFRVDLAPNSTYEVTVTLGDGDPRDGVNVTYSTDGGTVFSNGVTGVNTNAGERVHRTFTVTTGATGSLILNFADGGGSFSLWSLAAMEIRAAVTPFTMSSIGSVGADGSTVDNFSVTGATVGALYTISATNGVITTADADPYYSGVQVVAPAANFSVQVRRPGSTGTNNVSLSEVTGASRSTVGTATYTLAASRWFDFNVASVPVSPTGAGYIGVLTSTQYTAGLGYGWVSTVGLDQRDYAAVGDAVLRDYHWHRTGAQFRLDVAGTASAGSTITLRFRDPTARVFQVQVLDTSNTPLTFSPNGGANTTTHTYSVAANTTQTLTLTLQSGYAAGNLKVNFIGRFSINAIQFSTPQLAAGDYAGDASEAITPVDLDAIVAAAKARWLALPLTAEQAAVIEAAAFELTDFGADRHLGLAIDPRTLKIDDDAAGYGWFVDGSALDDVEFGAATGAALVAATGPAAGRFDLLTVVMHELGNALKLSGAGLPASAAELALPALELGTRRLPGGTAQVATTTTRSNGGEVAGSASIVLDDRTQFGAVKSVVPPTSAIVEAAQPPVALTRKASSSESTETDAFFSSFGKDLDLLPF